jgi:hypothetical protein
MNGAGVTRRPGRVAECRPDFRHQVVQAGVGKRPEETLENLRLGHSLRPAIEEKLRSCKARRKKTRPWRHHALPGVELAFTEDDTHSGISGFREIFPRTSGS